MPEKIRNLLAAAVRAPSSHNTQPWHFNVSDHRVLLYADRTRALPVNDPDDRELTISCGCALLNLRVAAATEGLIAEVETLPDARDPDLLASVTLGEAQGGADDDAELYPAIDERRTYRKRFEARPVPPETASELIAAAEREAAWLFPVTDDDMREETAELVAEGDAAQWASPSWRRELAAWMHPRRRGDGLNVPGLLAPVAQAVIRSFDMGGGVGARDSQIAEESPLITVLGTAGDRAADWLRAGQALERVLLTACRAGLQASYLNQPVQVAPLRYKLQSVIGQPGLPQIVLRLGFPRETAPATPRRELRDVVSD